MTEEKRRGEGKEKVEVRKGGGEQRTNFLSRSARGKGRRSKIFRV